jgi:hypothetical protein
MQLRGRAQRRPDPVKVLHLAEFMERNKTTTPVKNFPMTIFCNFLLDRLGQN